MSYLTGTWFGDDSAMYYILDDGKQVWWAGMSIDGVIENGIRSTSVFVGAYGGGIVSGQWVQVPRGQTTSSGPVTITIERDANGEAVHLVASGSPFGTINLWRIHQKDSPPANISTIFEHARRNGHNSMSEKVSVYKEPVVVYGTVRLLEDRFPITVNWPPTAGRTYQDFICSKQSSPPDGDMNFDITIDRAQLDLQNFWTTRWAKPPKNIIQKLDHHANDLHCEIVMYARDAKCSDLKPGRQVHKMMPGWQEQDGNSVLIDGVPINGSLAFGAHERGGVYELLSVAEVAFQLEMPLRVTGALCIDLGHGNDPAEIHPVYAIDVVRGTPQDDLSGVWADDNGGTYYVRQIGGDVWWYCADPTRIRSFTGVFHGTNVGGHVVGVYQDVPLGSRDARQGLDLELDATKLFLGANGDSANIVGRGLSKLRDAILAGPIG